jgi:adenine-specific DNA-methyltransferase
MAITHHQAKYFAYELTRRFPSDSEARLAGALVDAVVDLKPHRVDAGLCTSRSRLANGAQPGNEIGLEKTVEAGLVTWTYGLVPRTHLVDSSLASPVERFGN